MPKCVMALWKAQSGSVKIRRDLDKPCPTSTRVIGPRLAPTSHAVVCPSYDDAPTTLWLFNFTSAIVEWPKSTNPDSVSLVTASISSFRMTSATQGLLRLTWQHVESGLMKVTYFLMFWRLYNYLLTSCGIVIVVGLPSFFFCHYVEE